MDNSKIDLAVREENKRALAVAAGISDEEAANRLSKRVLVSFDRGNISSKGLVDELLPVLRKTLRVDLTTDKAKEYAVELIIGDAPTLSDAPKIFAVLRGDRLIVRQRRPKYPGQRPTYPLFTLIAACYLAGAVIGRAIGEGISNLPPEAFDVPFGSFAKLNYNLLDYVDVGEAYLAGAGAIGNGFLWAARYTSLRGRLHVADSDKVSAGNLQRQIWFKRTDVGKYKAEALCDRARGYIPECELKAAVCLLQDHPDATDGAWLERLIVGVDSRRSRRHLQNLFPGEVFDASTTGSEEIIIHHNKQPMDTACMGCIYYHNQQEISFDEAVAKQLGISVAEVQRQHITPEIAQRICSVHPSLSAEGIVGEAFDSLYKQLCSGQKLRSSAGKQVIAPLAFVSVLAGAFLVLELVRRQSKDFSDPTNFWRFSPWRPPVAGLGQVMPRRPDCECCRTPLRNIQHSFWKKHG